MINLTSLRLFTLLGPVFFCCIAGCDPLYELDVVVANKTGEPMTGVSYNVLEHPYKNQSVTENGDGALRVPVRIGRVRHFGKSPVTGFRVCFTRNP